MFTHFFFSGQRGFGHLNWLLLLAIVLPLKALADHAVYTDSLQNGWQDWGWATHNYANTSPVHSGNNSASVIIATANYDGLQIYHTDLDSMPYTNLSFWINGGASGGQQLQVYGLLHVGTTANASATSVSLGNLQANTWQHITLSLSSLGVANKANFTGFVIQSRIGAVQPVFYVDDISLITGAPTTPVTNAPASIRVDALLNKHPINPLVYGVAFASASQLSDLNAPLNRSGGNSETRYNWQINAHNHAADWYFQSLADSPATPGASADDFVADSKNGGAQSMITVPMIGWAPKLGTSGDGRLASYSIAKYGPQTGSDSQWFPDAGNGISTTNNTRITWNDPNDANTPVNSVFQQGFVQHLINKWGGSTNGGVRYYIMDNEHSLWQSTHQDVHPVGPTMQEIRDKIFDYASMVKSNDPNALVCGPEEWSWPGYFWSGYDQQWSGANNDYNQAHYLDRAANGSMDYMPWLLDQLHQHETNIGVRLLDCFTLHCYPQENNVGGNAADTATVLLRNQSTRQFWDTNFVDPSWINNIIMLIPRMKNWVANYYPGTKIGITEYNWGAENNISGATAQADIYGIFGREGLDLATRWTTPDAGTPTYKAMKMFRNYDGNKSTFGDTSVSATGPDPDYISTFAATRSSDGALTVMAINKQIGSNAPVTITLTNFLPAGTAQVWQLTAANTIAHLNDLNFSGGTFSNTLPAQSVTLFVLPAGTQPQLRASAAGSNSTFNFWLDGQTGQRYAIQASSDLVYWQTILTNMLAASSLNIILSATNQLQFYRAQWLP
ncbi:MAG: glycoside hydrolase family 44 protein [Limisphaerales bacterium]